MTLLATAASGGTAAAIGQTPAHARFRGIAFDGLAVFDLRSVAALAESRFPGRGAELMERWRTRQFEYQWLRALGGRYADFRKATEDSLKFSAVQMRVEMPDDTLQELMSAYARLDVWPDVAPTLQALHDNGLRLTMLSNMTRIMLTDGLDRAGLSHLFDAVLSTGTIRSYKPDPKAYAMALHELKLPREEILFVPFAGWDVAGARWFGYPTFWLNRARAPLEYLGVAPDVTGASLDEWRMFVLG